MITSPCSKSSKNIKSRLLFRGSKIEISLQPWSEIYAIAFLIKFRARVILPITLLKLPPRRRVEIARQIAVGLFKNEIMEVAAGEHMKFERKWWYDILKDLRGQWWDDHAKTIQDGITLQHGEEIYLEARGEDDGDHWRIFASSTRLKYQKAARVVYANKKSGCPNNDEDYECDGCGSCARVVPVFED